MEKNLDSQINLTKLKHVRMTKKGKEGKDVSGLFIPIAQNMLDVDEYGVHLPIRIKYREEQDEYKQNGFISKKIGSKVWKELTPEQQTKFKDYSDAETKAQTPILGNVKDWGSSVGYSGAASSEELSEDDDLPF